MIKMLFLEGIYLKSVNFPFILHGAYFMFWSHFPFNFSCFLLSFVVLFLFNLEILELIWCILYFNFLKIDCFKRCTKKSVISKVVL